MTLPALIPILHANPRIAKAQQELQRPTEELQGALSKYTRKFSDYAPLKDKGVVKAASSSKSHKENSSERFGKLIEKVRAGQKKKGDTVPGKVGACIMIITESG